MRRAVTPWFARNLAKALGIVAAVLPFSSCYVLNQGASLLRYQAAAEPVDRLLELGRFDDGTPVSEETRAFLREVEQIRAFSAGLGLAASENYTSLVPTERDHLADVVNATASLSFERHTWWWPFVGRLPYKGFYAPDDAKRLADRLRGQGLDVWVRPVDAFSTLGVLRDPLYEFMTGYDRHQVANLIIHEQAHATLFLRGHAQFNEEFATFVGDVGARSYIEHSGASAEEIELLCSRAADGETMRQLMLSLREELNRIYDSGADDDEKTREKSNAITSFQERVRDEYELIFRTDAYRRLSDIPINNAYVDLYVSYTEDLDLFRNLYEAMAGDMTAFVTAVSILEDPRQLSSREERRLARRRPKAFLQAYLLDSSGSGSVE